MSFSNPGDARSHAETVPWAPALRHQNALPVRQPSYCHIRWSQTGQMLPHHEPQHVHHGQLAYPRPQPSRTAQDGSEFRLRRKTPTGTVDAAYDASTSLVSQAPPPLKQIALTTTSTSCRTPLLYAHQRPPRQPVAAGRISSDLQDGQQHGHAFDRSATFYHRAPESCLSTSNAAPRPQHIGHLDPPMDGNTARIPDQLIIRAHERNVRAICPIPLSSSNMLPPEQLDWQSITWFGDTLHDGMSETTGFETPVCHAPRPSATWADAFWTSQHLNSEIAHHASDRRFPHANENHHTAKTENGRVHQDRFREKVLSQALSQYMDLLSHDRSHRSDDQEGMTTRFHLFPKPPKLAHRKHLPARSDQHAITPGFNKQMHGIRGVNAGPLRMTTNDVEAVPHPAICSRDDRERLVSHTQSTLEMLHSLCEQSGWKWIDGMLIAGCLDYALSKLSESLEWFNKVIHSKPNHTVAMTNAATTLYSLNRHHEAEQHWLRAVKIQPSYLEAVEHLVGLLYKRRSKEAVQIITFVQNALRLPGPQRPSELLPTRLSTASSYSISSQRSDDPQDLLHQGTKLSHRSSEHHYIEDCTSSGYAVPNSENGRLLALIHAKATMLYSLKDVKQAAKAFEEAVLISVGRSCGSVGHLVQRVQTALAIRNDQPEGSKFQYTQGESCSMFLSPEEARKTAVLVFRGNGELPGLAGVLNESLKRAASQTTSNSLLSLAKILQDAMSNGAEVPPLLHRAPGAEDILALYYLSLSLQESPSTANNVGILLAGMQVNLPKSSRSARHVQGLPKVTGVSMGSGLSLALAYYQYGLRLDPRHVHLHTNLGSLLKDVGQLDLAIQMYEQAVSCDGTFDIALTNLANAVKDKGRVQEAIDYYRRAVQVNPEFAEAVCGLYTGLSSICDWSGRGGAYLSRGRYDRWHVDDTGALVDARVGGKPNGLVKQVGDIVASQLREASRWGLGVLQDHTIKTLVEQLSSAYGGDETRLFLRMQQWAGRDWEGTRVVRLIERANLILMRRSFLQEHGRAYVGINAKQDSDKITRPTRALRLQLPTNLAAPPAPTILPFHTFTCPLSAEDIRSISQRNATRISCLTLRSGWLPKHLYPPPRPPSPQVIVGYVSSDFNNHPLAHLMQSVFGFHDARRVRAVCYATTPGDGSQHRQKIESEAPLFRDASGWSPEQLADQIVRDNIHILVNLNGYTRGAKNEIFAARPAPIQMSFMGFAGSLGAEWCDYLLADSIAIPNETLRPRRRNIDLLDLFDDETEKSGGDWMYSENIIFCQGTFFCCDHAQSADVSERTITWEEERARRWKMRKELFPALSDDIVIMGNFNQLYKIEPTTFRTWLRILAKTPKAVLWLLRFPDAGERNLRKTAKLWAGADVAERLVFTDVAPKIQHIARARVCDLFLDTPECNAHTTAADVLWSSTPLLTLPRYTYKMCSRMAASILRGALPRDADGDQAAKELTASTELEYEHFAVNLVNGLTYSVSSSGIGHGRGRLADLRRILWQHRWKCELFDTRRWVADVETAYEEAWRRWIDGEQGDFHLADLRT